MSKDLFSYTGVCRFCGQMKTIQSAHAWPEHVIDEEVTRQCDCTEARKYVRREEAKKNAEKAVEKLFGEQSKLKLLYGVELAEDLQDFMLQVVGMISDGKLYSCSVDEGRVKIRIAMNANGVIKLRWTYSASEEEKA